MNADLEAEARVRAITLFRDSLTRTGDPHRDPRVAIVRSTSTARRSTGARTT